MNSRKLTVLAVVAAMTLAAGTLIGLKISGQGNPDGQPRSGQVLAAEGMSALADCSNTAPADRYGCLQAAATTLDASRIDVVDRFFSTVDNDVLGPSCYGAAEALGRRVFTAHGLEARSEGGPACETGYLHGLLIAAASSGIPAGEFADTCHEAMAMSKVKDRWTPSMMLTCLVGIGRGVAVAVDTIIEGRDVCETVLAFDQTEEDGKRKGIDFCVRGVVNDKLTVESDVQNAIDQCVALEGTRAFGCLSLGLRIPGAATKEKNLQLARACTKLEGENVRYCQFALSDALAERLTITRQPVAEEALAICSTNDACPSHYAKYVLTVSWDPQYALESCSLLGVRSQEVCEYAVPDLVEAMIAQGHLPADKSLKNKS
jgi:hypothetical protein